MHLRLALGLSALAALLAAPTTFAAGGANITPVKRIPYVASTTASSAGTDLEFADFTIDGVKRTFSFAGTYRNGLQIIDVTQPENAELVATWDCGVSQGDVQVFRRPDLNNRVFVAYTHDTGYSFRGNSACAEDARNLPLTVPNGAFGTFIADVTDPYHPKTVSFVSFPQGSHNQTVHPSGRYLYNSNSDLITSFQPAIEIADITDLAAPVQLPELKLLTFPGLGTESHDLSFSADGTRAYVAALSHAEVIDTTNAAAPVSIGKLVDPAINVWHQAEAVELDSPLGKRNFLVVEDEVAGATPTGQCPNGGVHFYDITGDLEKAPVKVGYWNINDVGPTENGIGGCTAHVFQLHRKEKLMTIAYYNGGVRVVDISGLVGVALGGNGVGAKQLGWYRFADSNTWAVKAPAADRAGFYLYGNDQKRGFDVYRYQPQAGTTAAPGTWLSPERHLQAVNAHRAMGTKLTLKGVCLLGADSRRQLRTAAAGRGWRLR